MILKNRLLQERAEKAYHKNLELYYNDNDFMLKEEPKLNTHKNYMPSNINIILPLVLVGGIIYLSKYNNKYGLNNPYYVF